MRCIYRIFMILDYFPYDSFLSSMFSLTPDIFLRISTTIVVTFDADRKFDTASNREVKVYPVS